MDFFNRPGGLKQCSQSDYITIFLENLNLEGHQNCITGSRVTTILLNGWIFPIEQSGEASWWMVCYQRGLPRQVLTE